MIKIGLLSLLMIIIFLAGIGFHSLFDKDKTLDELLYEDNTPTIIKDKDYSELDYQDIKMPKIMKEKEPEYKIVIDTGTKKYKYEYDIAALLDLSDEGIKMVNEVRGGDASRYLDGIGILIEGYGREYPEKDDNR